MRLGGLLIVLFASLAVHAGTRPDPPHVVSFAPILGYDPVPGVIVGGAIFSAPADGRGADLMAQLITAPQQPRGDLALDVTWRELWEPWTPRISLRFHSFQSDFFGLGMTPDGTAPLKSSPYTSKIRAGLIHRFSPHLTAAFDGFFYVRSEDSVSELMARTNGADGPLEGTWIGAQAEAVYDSRDQAWGDAEGFRAQVWLREWAVQGTRALPRHILSANASYFLRLHPRVMLAFHADGAASEGHRGVLSTLHLGGADDLRGYVSERFRGDDYALGQAELRLAPCAYITTVFFADAGRVWLNTGDPGGRIAADVGAGLRWALPPGRRARVRADVGMSSERVALFVTFGDAF